VTSIFFAITQPSLSAGQESQFVLVPLGFEIEVVPAWSAAVNNIDQWRGYIDGTAFPGRETRLRVPWMQAIGK
jgi:hypothetical protein